MRAYWYADSMDVRMAGVLPRMDGNQASKFSELWQTGIQTVTEENSSIPEVFQLLQTLPQNLQKQEQNH